MLAALPLVTLALAAQAEPSLDDAQRAQLELVRADVARQTQLKAYDLLDELVVGWLAAPPFATETPVVIAEVTVPLGMGTGLEALLENHLAGLLLNNPGTRMVLTHCPACSAWVVRSTQAGTIVSRGVDQPEALRAAAGDAGGKHALFLDFEAEGQSYVLRARIVSLGGTTLPIVWARTLSSATTSAPLLRSSERLKSAAEARQEYVEILEGRGNLRWPVRLSIRSFASPPDQVLTTVPMPFVSGGAELSLSQARAWLGELTLGASWLPEVHTALAVQARISRLLWGQSSSLTSPDLYAFAGAALVGVQGPGALSLREQVPNVADLITAAAGGGAVGAVTIFPTAHVGLDVRVKNRIGGAFYLETLPTLGNVPTIGDYLNVFGIMQFQSIGGEVTFWF